MELIRTHDGLFKFVFGEPEQMAELLRACLPAGLVAAIDWTTLRRVPGSFVDKALKERKTDLLFTVRVGGATAFLYVVPEHKSDDDPFTAWQIAIYVVRILEQWRRENPDAKDLPAVLPFVLYHGDRPWRAPRSPHELVDWSRLDRDAAAFLEPCQMHLPFVLLDLSQVDEEQIEAMRVSAVTGLTLRFLQFLRFARPAESGVLIRAWQHLIARLFHHPRGQEVLVALLSWYTASNRADHDTLRTVMTQISEENPPMRSCLDLLLEMGQERGLRVVLEGQLRTRFGSVPDQARERIDTADAPTLERWCLRVLTANSVAEVLADA
ncbi:MAG: Rpn family recombination-promoting nuclease/putative transposase [Planctomycetota bacterium]